MNNLIIVENQLIPIYKNDEGQKLVNARDLHEWLESGQDFSTWIKGRIEQYGFIENVDFTSFHSIVEREIGATKKIEYITTLYMAKELSMVEKTEKGKEARKYFIQVENDYKEITSKQLTPIEQIKHQYQTLEEHEQKLMRIDEKVAYLENNMVIEYGQEVSIRKAVEKQVMIECGGSEAPAYLHKDLRGRIYRSIWSYYRCNFKITSYHNTPKKDFEKALDIVASWKPFGHILREIQEINNQESTFLSSIYTF